MVANGTLLVEFQTLAIRVFRVQHLFITGVPFCEHIEPIPETGSAHMEKPAMKKILLATLAAIIASGAVLTSVQTASAQYYDGPYRYDRRGPPPPPYRDPPRRHRDHDGRIIAGGIAAGVLGGIIGGALANSGPRYVEPPPPPPPRCWFEDRQIRNAYDGGWHTESFRVCQ